MLRISDDFSDRGTLLPLTFSKCKHVNFIIDRFFIFSFTGEKNWIAMGETVFISFLRMCLEEKKRLELET